MRWRNQKQRVGTADSVEPASWRLECCGCCAACVRLASTCQSARLSTSPLSGGFVARICNPRSSPLTAHIASFAALFAGKTTASHQRRVAITHCGGDASLPGLRGAASHRINAHLLPRSRRRGDRSLRQRRHSPQAGNIENDSALPRKAGSLHGLRVITCRCLPHRLCLPIAARVYLALSRDNGDGIHAAAASAGRTAYRTNA